MPSIQRLIAAGAVAVTCGAGAPGLAQSQAPMTGYETPADLEIYNPEPGKPKGSVLDATNPMDLLNRLRQATSMSDATDPVDAIDAALKGWESQTPAP